MATRRYQAEGPGGPADVSSGLTAVAGTQSRIADTLRGWSKRAAGVGAELRAEQGAKEGAAAGLKGPPEKKSKLTAYGESFNKAALAAHESSRSAELVSELDRIESEAQADLKTFDTKVAGYRRGLVENVDPTVRPRIEAEFDIQATARRNRVLDRERKTILDSNLAQLSSDGEVLRVAALNAARMGELDELELHSVKYQQLLNSASAGPDNPNGLVDATDAEKAKRAFLADVDGELVVGSFERTFREEGPEAAEAMLDLVEQGKDERLKDLSPEQRDHVIARMNAYASKELSKVARAQAADKAALAAREQAVREDWKAMSAALEAGFEVEGLEELVRRAKGTDLENEVNKGAMLSRQGAKFALLPLAAQERALQTRESELRGRKVKPVEAEQLKVFQRINDRIRTEVAQDPLGTAIRQGVVPALPALEFGDPDSLVAALQARRDGARQAEAHYGVKAPPFTRDEASTLAAAFAGGTAGQRTELMGSLAAGLGPRFESAMEQLHKQGHKTLAFVGGLALEDKETAREVMVGLDLVEGDKNLLPKDAMLRPELGALRSAYADPSAAVESVLALYARKSQVAGDSSGELDTDRLNDAINEVTGGLVSWESKGGISTFPAPKRGVDDGAFEDWMDELKPEVIGKLGGVSGIDDAEALQLIRSKGRLVSIGRGEFLVSVGSASGRGDRYLTGNNGEPFVLRWEE